VAIAATTFSATASLALAVAAEFTAVDAIRLAWVGEAVIAAPTIALEMAGAITSDPRVVAIFTPEDVKAATCEGAAVTAEATAARVIVWDNATVAVSFLAAMVVVATTPAMTFGARAGD